MPIGQATVQKENASPTSHSTSHRLSGSTFVAPWQRLDSDQQYHALCNYHYKEANIVSFFAKPNVTQHQFIIQTVLNIKLWKIEMDNGKSVFRNLLAKWKKKNTVYFAV